jgi:hypothetical protein
MPGFTTEEIRANKAYAARHLLTPEDLQFAEFRVSFSGLSSWIRTTGIETRHPREDGKTRLEISYCRPEQVEISVGGDSLAIGFAFRASESMVRDVTLRENVQIRVTSSCECTDDELHKRWVSPLQDFFTLATDRANLLEEFVVYNKRLKESNIERASPIRLLGQPRCVPTEERRPRLPQDMLFTYEDVQDSLAAILNRWIEFSRANQVFCRVFFGLVDAPRTFVEDRFLRSVQAIALFFGAGRYGQDPVARELMAAQNGVLQLCAEDQRQRLSAVLPTEAEVSLPSNLLAALSDHREIMGPLVADDPEGFANRIIATRAYLTRYDPALPAPPLDDERLLWATEKLAVLLKACILECVGIPRDQMARLFHRNRKYQHLKTVV